MRPPLPPLPPLPPHSPPHRSTTGEIAAATGRTVPDLVAPGLDVLFCGINPGLMSAAVGHHFARPGNRFWKVLHASGFTTALLVPEQQHQLLDAGLGVTNLVTRSSANASALTRDELRRGAQEVASRVEILRPRFIAFLGMGAFRSAFDRPEARLGEQPGTIAGARIWLLPNPSGAQARYQLDDLVAAFAELRHAVGERRARDCRALPAMSEDTQMPRTAEGVDDV